MLRHCPGGTRLIRWTLLRHASDRQRVGRAEPRRPMRMYEAHCGQLTERHGPGVRRAADYRSIPLERGATLPDPRSRRALRSRCQAPITGHGGSRGPFRNSSSRACLPTNRSRAAIRASYSWIRSAARASSSKAPSSYLRTQIRIRLRRQTIRSADIGDAAIEADRCDHIPL